MNYWPAITKIVAIIGAIVLYALEQSAPAAMLLGVAVGGQLIPQSATKAASTSGPRILSLAALCVVLVLPACTSPGAGSAAATNVPQTQGAQTVGGNQGQASAAETGSATSQSNPVVVNILAAKKVTMGVKSDGGTELKVEGADDAEVTINAAEFGYQRFGNEATLESEVSSGGGAAGGTGGASRSGAGSGNATTGTGQ